MQYAFLNFHLDRGRGELTRDGELLHAEPQILDLLALFVEHPGETLSKEAINESVWRGRVVSDAALSGRIKSLRQLLGDDGKRQEIIRTVHKRGFRFLPEVHGEAGSAADTDTTHTGPDKPPAHDRPTIAVLPFRNLARNAEQDYFSDGVSADLITHLSRHRWLNVIARNTAFAFRDSTLDTVELGAALGARYLVEFMGMTLPASSDRLHKSLLEGMHFPICSAPHPASFAIPVIAETSPRTVIPVVRSVAEASRFSCPSPTPTKKAAEKG